jgi:hypothetical protein
MAVCAFVLGGTIMMMLDNSDPITSGQYMVKNDLIPPEEDPFPSVKVEPENTPDKVSSETEKLAEFVNDAIEKGKEVISEITTDEETKGKAKKAVGGGIGIGTLVGAYVVYKWIFG